jgi:hypothetical protein
MMRIRGLTAAGVRVAGVYASAAGTVRKLIAMRL